MHQQVGQISILVWKSSSNKQSHNLRISNWRLQDFEDLLNKISKSFNYAKLSINFELRVSAMNFAWKMLQISSLLGSAVTKSWGARAAGNLQPA